MSSTATIELGGAHLHLLAGRAAHWPERDALLVSDLHFGKAAALRAAGRPVPPGTTAADLARLDELLAATGAERLWITGDFMHSPSSRHRPTLERLAAWFAARPQIERLLVRGNHDLRAGDPPPEWGFEVVDEPWDVGPWCLCHYPRADLGKPSIAGHLHPGVAVTDASGEKLKRPAFLVRRSGLVLPSFGALTGSHVYRGEAGERVFAVGETALHEVPRSRRAVRPLR